MRYLLLFLSMLAAFAQTRPLQPSLMEDAGKDNLPSQKLGVDDLIAVSVYDAPELTRTLRVEEDGTIHLPLLKDGRQGLGHVRPPIGNEHCGGTEIGADSGGSVREGDCGRIPQPADFSDGRGFTNQWFFNRWVK